MFGALKRIFKFNQSAFLSIDVGENNNALELACRNSKGEKHVAAAIPSSLAIAKTISIDAKLDSNELKNFLMLNAEKYLDYPLDSVNLDYQIIKQTENKMEIRLVAVRKEQILNYVELFKKAGLILKIVDIDIFALAKGASWVTGNIMVPYAVVHVDQKRLLFCVLNNNELIYFQGNYTHPDILAEIITNLQMYNSVYAFEIQKILLTGTLASDNGLTEHISQGTGLSVERLNISLITLGLSKPFGVNLLPWREELKLKKQKRLIKYLSLVLVCIFVFLFIHQENIKKDLHRILLKNQLLEQELKILVKQHMQLIELRRTEKDLLPIQNEHIKILALLTDFSRIVPANVYFTELQLQKNNTVFFTGNAKTQQDIEVLINNFEIAKCAVHPEIVSMNATEQGSINFKMAIQTCK